MTSSCFEDEIPDQFAFDEARTGSEHALYVQDTLRAGAATLSAGLRVDRYSLMVNEHAVSPRLSGSWAFDRAAVVLHAAYDRTFETQPVENIILASTDLVEELGAEGESRVLRPSRGHFVEGGVAVTVRNRVRLEATPFARRAHDVTDDELLLNTAISFPIAFASARVHGLEAAIDVPRWGPFSASVGSLPLTGGLFIGDEAGEGLESDQAFELSQDQRHTLRARLRADLTARGWVAGMFRFDSGLPVEIEGELDGDLVERQYGAAIVERVNFERGRVVPSLTIDLSAGVRLAGSATRAVRLQADIFNVLDRLNVINFAGVLSGTAMAPRRSFAVRLHAEF